MLALGIVMMLKYIEALSIRSNGRRYHDGKLPLSYYESTYLSTE
jgi:hypothetical protein